MKKELTIEDFEVVKENEPVDGCLECHFFENINNVRRCVLLVDSIGDELENHFGNCEDGHHYKLKN